MDLIIVRELYEHPEEYPDKETWIGGWIHSLRDSRSLGSAVVGDGSYSETLQVAYYGNLSNFAEVFKLNVGTATIVKGILMATPDAKQPFEIQAIEVTAEGTSAPDYPLQRKRHSFECLRSTSYLRPKTNTFQAVFRVRLLITYAIHQYFQERDLVYVHTLLITGSDCEGAGEVFQAIALDLNNILKTGDGKVDFSRDFFNKPTNLTVSGQLNAETYTMASRNVYTSGPTFRTENSNTVRHVTEFWMIEPEVVLTDLDDNMCLAEGMPKYTIKYMLEHAPEEMNFFNQFVDKGLLERLNSVLNAEFGHITHTDAVELLEKYNDEFDYKMSWECDLQTEHERYLTEKVFEKPVFVTDYPKKVKAFYMKMNPDSKTAVAMDRLVLGIGEIIGGSQRGNSPEKLTARMDELDLNKDDYGFYLGLRRYGSTRHAGFGLGFERYVMHLTGMGNTRDVIPFPKTVNNCEL